MTDRIAIPELSRSDAVLANRPSRNDGDAVSESDGSTLAGKSGLEARTALDAPVSAQVPSAIAVTTIRVRAIPRVAQCLVESLSGGSEIRSVAVRSQDS